MKKQRLFHIDLHAVNFAGIWPAFSLHFRAQKCSETATQSSHVVLRLVIVHVNVIHNHVGHEANGTRRSEQQDTLAVGFPKQCLPMGRVTKSEVYVKYNERSRSCISYSILVSGWVSRCEWCVCCVCVCVHVCYAGVCAHIKCFAYM